MYQIIEQTLGLCVYLQFMFYFYEMKKIFIREDFVVCQPASNNVKLFLIKISVSIFWCLCKVVLNWLKFGGNIYTKHIKRTKG